MDPQLETLITAVITSHQNLAQYLLTQSADLLLEFVNHDIARYQAFLASQGQSLQDSRPRYSPSGEPIYY